VRKYFVLLIGLTFLLPAAFGEVSIQNDQQYIGDDGAFHVVGEIQNDLNLPLNQVSVFVTLYDENQKVIVTNLKADEIKSYSLDFDYSISDPKGQVIGIISSELNRDNFNNIIISGTVENNGENTANTVAVIATLYDKEGNVAAVSRVHPEPDYLSSEDDVFFVVSMPDKNQISEVTHYTVVAESEEYAAVPEFPIGSIFLLVLFLHILELQGILEGS
jgi:hypothetical protein